VSADVVPSDSNASSDETDVLVVGAGPTGLTLACQLVRFGVRFRIIDKQADRTRESRALGVQARSLEVLQTLGLGEMLAGRGRTTTRLKLHVDRGEPPEVDLGAVARADTRFPYILFVSQANTEAVMVEYLELRGVIIERGVELTRFHVESDSIACVLRHGGGREESCRVRYLGGCDGAHSTIRKGTSIPFEGGAYPQTFALGDVEADGPLESGVIHAFGMGRGIAIFFPLGNPTTWRVMAMDADGSRSETSSAADDDVTTHDLSLAELQAMVDDPTFGLVRLRDPAWLTRFRLHHRQAARYQQGRVFLAGDAAHIHSPVGAQGMNTGIQDAWNLGWKLATVAQGRAVAQILDSYDAERWPVGRTLLRATDRLFGAFAKSLSGSEFVMTLRRIMVRGVVAPALSRPRVRAVAFHFVSQLGIRYRNSPAVTEGEPRLRRGPKAGDRFPDARVRCGRDTRWLHEELGGPHLHLLLCGPLAAWKRHLFTGLEDKFPGLLVIKHLTRENSESALVDHDGEALTRLGVEDTGQYLVRPDGHVAFRCAGTDLGGVTAYLQRWFTVRSTS
jgi:2-polyprenyl-6-methoxyphenol hydroxylase-like FAD-dependent oxidoreductase